MEKALLLLLPSTYGRSLAGVTAYPMIQDNDTTTVTAPATARCPRRRRQVAGAATR
jgi:hypothetical protein